MVRFITALLIRHLSIYLTAATKYLAKATYTLHQGRKGRGRKTGSLIASKVKKQRTMNVCDQFTLFFFIHPRTPKHEMTLFTLRVGLSEYCIFKY